MATVKHPRTGDLLTVPDADLDDWLEQGWVDAAPAPVEPAPSAREHTKTPRSATTRKQ